MKKYRKKSVEIEAMLWDGDVSVGHPVPRWIRDSGGKIRFSPGNPQRLLIETLEGDMAASSGDYIIRGLQGEFYPCKPNIFEATYEEEK